MAKIVEDRKAPQLSLPDAIGKKVSASDFRGRDVVYF